jgi:hypothetical protein
VHRLRSLSALARLVAAALLLTLAAALPSSIAASYAEWCCGDCGDDEQGCSDEGGGERDCDCPLDCTACCSASLARAVAPDAPAALSPPLVDSALPTFSVFGSPPHGVSRDILHVPKLAA